MIRFLIERPIAVTMGMVAVLILGLLSISFLPVSLMPEVDIPQVTVRINAPGISARELENVVVEPLKNQLRRVNHLASLKTESRDGYGNIYLEFTHGADINLVFIEVNEKIDRVSYPAGLERPQAVKASATDLPAFYVNVFQAGKSGQEEESIIGLSKFVLSVVQKRIEQLPEVAMVDISGQVLPEIRIVPDKVKMEGLGITERQLENVILGNDVRLGNLVIIDGELQYNIHFSAALKSKTDIENIYLRGGERVYQMKEIASVTEIPQEMNGLVRSDGQRAVSLAIIKQSDARMSDLQRSLNSLLKNVRRDYPDLGFTVTRDQTSLLDYSIQNLKNNLLVGILLASLLVFLFMQDWRSPLLIILTIPLALIVSMLFLYALGISVNIISLSGLLLGVGMMVDNSIIVIDNITQYRQRGMVYKDAVAAGAGDVFAPMLSSVLTTCAVFLPLIFLSGIAGALFYDQALAVTVSLLSSLLVSVLIIPVYYHLLYRSQAALPGQVSVKRKPLMNYEQLYEKGMVWVFRHQLTLAGIIGGIVLLGGISYFILDKSKLPAITEEDMLLNIDWNQRVSMAENDRRCNELAEAVHSLVTHTTVMAGIQQFLLSHTKENTASEAIFYLKADSPRNLQKVKEQLASFMKTRYPDAVYGITASGNIFDMIFSEDEPPLVARVQQPGKSFPEIDKLNGLILQLKQQFPEMYIEPVAGQEYVRLQSNPEMMALYEVDYQNLLYSLKTLLKENKILSLYEGQFTVPVNLGNEKKQLGDMLEHHKVINAKGVSVPLSYLIRVDQVNDLKKLTSGPEGGYYPLGFRVDSDKVPQVMGQLRNAIRENGNFEVAFSGSYFSSGQLLRELMMVLAVAIALLYFILAAQFESLVQPLIILFELITDIAGAFLFLWLLGGGLNLMSMIGIVVMCGIVINDSILKVDTINKLRKEGHSLLKAILTAGVRRLKPILLTSLTTIFAIAPFLVRGTMGADLQYPLSVAIIGGMIIGTVVSIYVVPLVYYYIYKGKGK